MFKIGEFSQLGQVSSRMLRHYDKLGLLVPSETDAWTGYRYYTIDQLARLHRIVALKDLGLSLQQIGELLAADDDLPLAQLQGMLRLKQAEVEREIDAGRNRLQRIAARLAQLEAADGPSPYEIAVKSIAPQPIASIRAVVPHIAEMGFYCASMTQQIYRALRAAHIRPLQPELILYHETEYKETDLDVEAAVAVHPRYVPHPPLSETLSFREAPGHELAASLIYEGPYSQMTPAILALLRWIGLNRHVPVGPLRELHLSGPAHPDGAAADDADAVTELIIPIERRG